MPVNKTEFAKLEMSISATNRSYKDSLAPKIGRIYVVAITRDGCPACTKQKPRFRKLAKAFAEKHGSAVVFTEVHVRRQNDSDEESLRSKDIFGHYFYPTNLILLRTSDRGAIEYYRNASPEMRELKRNIETALEIAAFLEKEKG